MAQNDNFGNENGYRNRDSKAHNEFYLKSVTDIVTSLVKDSTLASQVNAAITAKLADSNQFDGPADSVRSARELK